MSQHARVSLAGNHVVVVKPAIEAQRDAAVRRSAELERIEQEAEALAGLLGTHAERAEQVALHLRIVNTNASAADLVAVEYEVVGLRLDGSERAGGIAQVVVGG